MLCVALLGMPVAGLAQERTERPAEQAAQKNAEPVQAGATTTVGDRLPRLNFTPQMLYKVLLAEIAGNRGNIGLATSLYGELAKTTRDPRIARRATEISIYARQTPLALEMARIWVQADPESPQARQTLAGLLLSAKQTDEALPHLARLLTMQTPQALQPDAPEGDAPGKRPVPPSRSPAATSLTERLDQIYRLLARYPDKAVALRLIEQLTAAHEDVPEAHYVRAQAAIDAKDDARALAAIERAQALRPDWQQAVLFKAQVQQRISTTLAEQTLRGFLAEHPKASEVRIAYARSLIGGKHYDAARREFNTLLEENRDNGEVLYAVALLSMQLNDLPAAEKHLKRLLELGIGNPNLLRYYLGQITEETKRTVEALEWYAKVTPGEQYLPALGRAAALLAKEGRLDEGRALLQRAGEVSPEHRVQVLVAESQLLVNVGRTGDAYELLDRALVSQPEQPELLYETALLAEKLDKLEIMERNLRKLIRIKPDDAHAYNALGYSLAERNLRLDEAQQLIEKGLALAPEDPFILDSKGWLLYRRGAHSAALEVLRKAYGIRQDAEIAAHLGEVLWISGQREEAQKTWAESAKANPGNPLLDDTIKKFKATDKADTAGKPAPKPEIQPAQPVAE